MQTRSAIFDLFVQKHHTIAIKMTLQTAYGTSQLASFGLGSSSKSGPVAGSVTIDKTAANRRTCSITFTDPTGLWIPSSTSSNFAANGNEVVLWRGIQYPSGYPLPVGVSNPELMQLGVFRITQVEAEDSGSTVRLAIRGSDRSIVVADAKLINAYNIAVGTNYATAIKNLLASSVPQLTFNFAATTYTTPAIALVPGDDPWAKAIDMASAIGMDLAFDAFGVCTLKPIPDPTQNPVVWTYAEGQQAMILDLRKDFDSKDSYNYVVVDGENSSNTAPIRGVAFDNASTSPTYYLGPYGRRVHYVKSSAVTTQAQADAMAAGLLLLGLGTQEGANFPAIVHPAHQEDDVVQITRQRMSTNARYALDSIVIPLEAGTALQATTRKRMV